MGEQLTLFTDPMPRTRQKKRRTPAPEEMIPPGWSIGAWEIYCEINEILARYGEPIDARTVETIKRQAARKNKREVKRNE